MKIVIVCGEPSGDQLGAGLARALLELNPQAELSGVTGTQMRAAGVRSWLDCEVFAVMGYWDVLRKIWPLWRAYRRIEAKLRQEQPAMFIGVDAPDLNLRLGAAARACGAKYVQYVCPSFWAWRAERAAWLARHCDHVLALLPFERKLCENSNISASFVGHRLVDELTPDHQSAAARAQARAQLGISSESRVLALLPGSRVQEVTAHAPLFVDAARLCRQRYPKLEVVMAPAPGVARQTASVPDVRYCPGQARVLLAAADAAIVKSGTITLEAALLGCPQVIAYRSKVAVRLRLGDIYARDYGLPNLVAGERIVPELIARQATATALAAAVHELFEPSRAATMKKAYQGIRAKLGGGADQRAAQAVAKLLPT